MAEKTSPFTNKLVKKPDLEAMLESGKCSLDLASNTDMTLFARSLAILAILIAVGGCDDRGATNPQPAAQFAAATASLDERLLQTLDSRRQWPSNAVKIWLKNPTVALEVKATDGKTIRLHAWGCNENDYNIAMMRLNDGDVLYAITNAEFEEFRIRAAASEIERQADG